MAENVFDRAKDAVVGAVRGTGDIVGSVRTTTSDVVTGTLRSAGDIAAAVVGVVTDTVRGALRGARDAGIELAAVTRGVVSGAIQAVGEVGGDVIDAARTAPGRRCAGPPRSGPTSEGRPRPPWTGPSRRASVWGRTRRRWPKAPWRGDGDGERDLP